MGINHYYEFGPFLLDTERRLLLRQGQPVLLTPKAFDILLLLVRNSGRALRKDELMKLLWPDAIVEESNLTVHICRLRKALGESLSEHRYVLTLPGRGYRFVASVSEVWRGAADSAPVERLRVHQLAAGPQTVWSLAVLPFRSLDGESRDEFLGLGMADALITKLSNVRQIIMRPTSSTLKYKDGAQDLAVIGRELGVNLVLDGCFQKMDGGIRVTIQLISVPDGALLWAEKFDDRFTNIFVVQDSIAEQIIRILMLKLTGAETEQLSKSYTGNVEAYQLYVKGRYFWNKRTAEGLKKGIEYFERAVEKDPGYALAYAGLADCYNILGWFNHLAPVEAFPRAKAAALKALRIDQLLAEAHTSLAYVKYIFDWNWIEAEKELKRALELKPNYATAHHWYAIYLAASGRMEEAITEIEQAQAFDPTSIIINAAAGWIFFFARQYDQALEQCRKALEMDPHFWAADLMIGMDSSYLPCRS